MIILLAAAYFLENLIDTLRLGPMMAQGPRLLYLISVPIAFLVLAMVLLLLFRFAFGQEKRNRFISVFFIVVGIGLAFYPTFHYGLGWGPRVPLFMDWVGYKRPFFLTASIFVSAIGVLSLVRRGWRQTGSSNPITGD